MQIPVTAVTLERRVGVTHKIQYSNGELSLRQKRGGKYGEGRDCQRRCQTRKRTEKEGSDGENLCGQNCNGL